MHLVTMGCNVETLVPSPKDLALLSRQGKGDSRGGRLHGFQKVNIALE